MSEEMRIYISDFKSFKLKESRDDEYIGFLCKYNLINYDNNVNNNRRYR